MTLPRLKKLSLLNLYFAVICVLAMLANSYLWRHGIDSYVDEHGILLLIPTVGLLFSTLIAFILILLLTYKGIFAHSFSSIKLPLSISLIVFLSVAIPIGSARYKHFAQDQHIKNCITIALDADNHHINGLYASTLSHCLSE